VARAEANLHAKFHLDPTSRLATVHQRHRQTDIEDRQRCDSINQEIKTEVISQTTDRKKLEDFTEKECLVSCDTELKQRVTAS